MRTMNGLKVISKVVRMDNIELKYTHRAMKVPVRVAITLFLIYDWKKVLNLTDKLHLLYSTRTTMVSAWETPSNSCAFGPSVLAPFSNVTLKSNYIDGVFIC
jgi:hypothetical protein